MPVTTTIDLLRHGDVVGGSKYRGHLDEPLSELGWQQLRKSTEINQDWQKIVSSPLIRCADFANELSVKSSLPLELEDNFKEVFFGLWEGKTADELLKLDKVMVQQYWNDPINTTPPQGENLLDFESRVITGWNNILTKYQGQHVLVISHAGVMRIILCHILAMPLTELFKLDIGLAKASRIEIIHDVDMIYPRLIFHGSTFV